MQRKSIEIPGIPHTNPIPSASKIGPFLASGSIFGKDPANNGAFVEGPEAQAAMMFANVKRLMEAAGGSTDNVLKLEVWVKEPAFRAIVNQQWLVMFPDEKTRPARHTFITSDIAPGALMQCSVLAVLPD
ncbi:MAG: RidA family protein [Acidobacteriota bacterium]